MICALLLVAASCELLGKRASLVQGQLTTKIARKPQSFQAGDEVRSFSGAGVEGQLIKYVVHAILNNMEYIHEQHTVHLIVYHIIWCPKRRRKVLQGKVADHLKQIIHEVVKDHEWEVLTLAIQPDHVHLFLRANPYTLPTDIARLIKGRSSHLLREAFPHLLRMPSLWTRSTFYSTAGNVSAEIIQQYIERQSKT